LTLPAVLYSYSAASFNQLTARPSRGVEEIDCSYPVHGKLSPLVLLVLALRKVNQTQGHGLEIFLSITLCPNCNEYFWISCTVWRF